MALGWAARPACCHQRRIVSDRERGGVVVVAHAHPAGVGGDVVDAVRVGLAQVGVHEVVDVDLLRVARRAPLRPPLLGTGPTSSFFLVSTLITGSPGGQVLGWPGRSGSRTGRPGPGAGRPRSVLALACRLNPCSRSSFATVRADTGCPAAVSSPASVRIDFVVHRSGDSGSPRSARLHQPQQRRAATRIGVLGRGFRPPPDAGGPGPRRRPGLQLRHPLLTVTALDPGARATAAIPPWPNDRASAANASRRGRSSRCGSSAAN